MRRFPDTLRAARLALSPARFPYGRFAAALALGGGGGALLSALALPLPWMLGSMAACTLGALGRAPIAAPAVVRPPMTMVIGVLLGAGFSPQVIGQMAGWLPTMLGLVLFVVASGLGCVLYFRRVAGFDPVTAYFAGMPGGLVEMVVLGEERGGDGRAIALIHSARVLLIVLTLPFGIELLGGVDIVRPRAGLSVWETPWTSEVLLVGTALAGVAVGRLLRLRPAYLLGPMLVSAAVHGLGLTDFVPPVEVVNAAQLVIGAVIGCSFVGTGPRAIGRVLLISLGSTAILLATTALFAVAVSRVSTYGVLPLVLAYSPGGLAEMSLIALALQIEVAFVAAHHIARVLLVALGADLVFRFTQ